MTQRRPTAKELVHESLAPQMERLISNYDTQRRVEVLVDQFLGAQNVAGRAVLEVGCGLGFFSQRLVTLGGNVLACDLGERLVAETRRRAGCEAVVADALDLERTFGRDRFDIVVSSECIEHTPNPAMAVEQMLAVVKPGGLLSISTPNVLWQPVVRAATRLGLRPFDGHEHFSSWPGLRRVVRAGGGTVLQERGLHLFPFQFGAHTLSRYLDERLHMLRPLMINICLLARKDSDDAPPR